jgi:MoxR-like ATPase
MGAHTYSWAPQCAIGAAERDDIERAARQALRVLGTKHEIFQKASVEDPAEVAALGAAKDQAERVLQQELSTPQGDGEDEPSAAAPLSGSTAGSPQQLQARIRQTLGIMERGLIERETESRLMLLAALCGEHLLLLGPPGTAKSALSRQLSNALHTSYFERQLTRFSVPEELFGPLSLTELQQDRYLRKTEGYLPEASIAFIDEVFKANSAILNSLLTIINEREFDNGNSRVPVPLISLVGASNEAPDDDELEALFDRFLLRRHVNPVSREARPALLELEQKPSPTDSDDSDYTDLFTETELADLKAIASTAVTIPPQVKQLIEDLLAFLDESGVYVSDRRLVKAAKMLRVAALTSGRDAVTKFDCLLLQHVFWKNPDEAEKIQEWFVDYFATPGAEVDQVLFLLSGLFNRIWRAAAASDITSEGKQHAELRTQWADELRKFKTVLLDKLHRWEEELSGDIQTLNSNIWQTEKDMARLTQRLRPNLESRQNEVRELLREVCARTIARPCVCRPNSRLHRSGIFAADCCCLTGPAS